MIRVVGIGSPFGDDQVGWRVIELLRGRLDDIAELVALDRPGVALISWMDGADWFVLVDALGPQGAPGTVHRLDPDALPDREAGLSSHALRLAETLRLAEALGCRPARLEVYGIEIAGLESAVPCDAVEAGASRLAQALCETLARRENSPPG